LNTFLNLNSLLLILCFFILLLSLNNIKIRTKRKLFLTSITGLHITILVFFAVGPFFYSLFGLVEREPSIFIFISMNKVYPYLFFGYFIISIIEYRNRNKISNEDISLIQIFNNVNLNKFNFTIVSLTLFSIFFPSDEITSSGLGTIFPVLSNFLLPITILIVFNLKKNDSASVFIFIVTILIAGYNAFLSSWRSQLFLFLGSLLIGWNLKSKINQKLLIFFCICIFLILLPFQQAKKLNVEREFDTIEEFTNSLNYSLSERIEIGSSFFSERINYGRELGYVQNALDQNRLELRNGETYKEIFYQLIPRFLWPYKPSYNQFTGREIPRKIGLVGFSDENTSWAVNSFAEYIYNFSYETLPIFIFLIYFLLFLLDFFASKWNLSPSYKWLLKTTLFFLSLNLVSVIFSSTYFIWTFIVIKVLDYMSKLKKSA
jgi:hypothetical protein